jgi:VWFA-related protein
MVRAGQEEEMPVFRAQSELVLVDLVVSDKKGNIVQDLKPEDIEVFEDGERQNIVFFDLRKRAGSKEELISERAVGASPISDLSFDRRALPTSPVDQGYFVFLFDMQAMDFHGLQRAKDSIRTFINSQLAPTDQVMVATIEPSFRVHLPFTSDPSLMVSALETLSFRAHADTSISRFVESVEQLFSLLEGIVLDTFDPGDAGGAGGASQRLDPALEGTISQAASLAREMLVSLELRVDFTCSAIGALSRHLGSLPGRKHLLYLSNGYPLSAKQTLSRIIKQRAMAYSPAQITLIHIAVNNFMLGTGRSSALHRRRATIKRCVNSRGGEYPSGLT